MKESRKKQREVEEKRLAADRAAEEARRKAEEVTPRQGRIYGEGPGGPGPEASHQQGVSHQTPQFLKPRNSIANPGLHNFCYHLCIVK